MESKTKHYAFTDVDTTAWTDLTELCKNNKYRITSNRGLSLYKKLFSSELLSLDIYLKNLTKDGKELNALDCGAGRGVALKNLLNEHKEFQCTGISIHAFMTAAEDIKKFNGRLDYYFDKAQNVLTNLPSNKYHLITDVWGAYFYSIERPQLLEEYWRLLKPKGCAFIILGNSLNDVVKSEKTGRIESFIKYLIKMWPTTFQLFNKNKEPWLMIQKQDIKPTMTFEIIRSHEQTISSKNSSKHGTYYPDQIMWKIP